MVGHDALMQLIAIMHYRLKTAHVSRPSNDKLCRLLSRRKADC